LPARDALRPGTQTGSSGDYRWRIDAVPLAGNAPDQSSNAAAPPKWMPLAITVQVQSGDGPPVRLDTVRLIPRPPG
jgi:hypothetical protein